MNPKIVAMDREYSQYLARARAAGLPSSAAQLAQPLPPADENAGPIYLQLRQLLRTRPLDVQDKLIDNIPVGQIPSSDWFVRAKRACTGRSDVLSLIHQAVAKPKCVIDRDWSTPDPIDILYPELATIRQSARILTAESLVMADGGDPLGAVRNESLGFRMASHAANGRTLIPCLVALAINSITIAGLDRILYMSHGDPKVAAAVQQAIDQNCRQPDLSNALRAECGISQGAITYLRSTGNAGYRAMFQTKDDLAEWAVPGRPEWNEYLDANSAFVYREMLLEVSTANWPYWRAKPVMQAVAFDMKQQNRPDRVLGDVLLPEVDKTIIVTTRGKATALVTRAGAAVLAWKGEHSSYPSSLSQAMGKVPVDPFDGKSLRYHREGNGFVVYSVGPTGKFDGGTPAVKPPSTETAFRFPMPAYLAPANE